jgi:hypothetical protein
VKSVQIRLPSLPNLSNEISFAPISSGWLKKLPAKKEYWDTDEHRCTRIRNINCIAFGEEKA